MSFSSPFSTCLASFSLPSFLHRSSFLLLSLGLASGSTPATYRARFAPVSLSFRSRRLLASFSYRFRLASRLASHLASLLASGLSLRPFSYPSYIMSFTLRSRFILASSRRSRFDCRFALPSVSLRGSLRVRFDLAWCSLRARVVLASFSLRWPSFV